MDYFIGMLIGYFIKEFITFIGKLSNYDYGNVSDEWDLFPLDQDDLP